MFGSDLDMSKRVEVAAHPPNLLRQSDHQGDNRVKKRQRPFITNLDFAGLHLAALRRAVGAGRMQAAF